MKNTLIKELKMRDRFKFNETVYVVRRKYIDDNRPLIAYDNYEEHRFYFDELEVQKLEREPA